MTSDQLICGSGARGKRIPPHPLPWPAQKRLTSKPHLKIKTHLETTRNLGANKNHNYTHINNYTIRKLRQQAIIQDVWVFGFSQSIFHQSEFILFRYLLMEPKNIPCKIIVASFYFSVTENRVPYTFYV